MTRRNINHKMFDEQDISSTQTQQTASNVESIDQAVAIIDWAGASPVGVITFEGSNSDQNDITKGTATWETLDFGAPINITGNSGSHQVMFTSLPYKWLRVVYTSTSGTGTLTAHINGASLGA